MEESTKRIAERFQCRYTVFKKGTAPEPVEQAYRRALKAGRMEGFYPAIFLLDEYAVEWLEEVVSQDYDRDEIIANCGDNGKEQKARRISSEMKQKAKSCIISWGTAPSPTAVWKRTCCS